MVELLSRLNPGDLTAVLTVTVMVALGIVAVVARLIADGVRRHHERELATSLVLEMLDRGMTADDIVRVLSAAGLEDRGDELASLRNRVRQKLGRALPAATVAPPKAEPKGE
jgi:hypothetical protein